MSPFIIDLTGGQAQMDQTTTASAVTVTLSSLDGDLDRVLALDSSTKSVAIGRSSKIKDRKMIPGRGNAWIQSPIVSRDHARLSIEPSEDKALYITDVGSTHGSKLNGRTLDKEKKARVITGDILAFGSTINTSTETFRAKKFEVKCRWEKCRLPSANMPTPAASPNVVEAPRTFSVPDEDSGDDSVEEIGASSKPASSQSSEFILPTATGQAPLSAGKPTPRPNTVDDVLIVSESSLQHSLPPAPTSQALQDSEAEGQSKTDPNVKPSIEKENIGSHSPQPTTVQFEYISDSSSESDEEAPEALPIGQDQAGATSQDLKPDQDDQIFLDSDLANGGRTRSQSPRSGPASPSYLPDSPGLLPTCLESLAEVEAVADNTQYDDLAEDEWIDESRQVDAVDEATDFDDIDENAEMDYPSSPSAESYASDCEEEHEIEHDHEMMKCRSPPGGILAALEEIPAKSRRARTPAELPTEEALWSETISSTIDNPQRWVPSYSDIFDNPKVSQERMMRAVAGPSFESTAQLPQNAWSRHLPWQQQSAAQELYEAAFMPETFRERHLANEGPFGLGNATRPSRNTRNASLDCRSIGGHDEEVQLPDFECPTFRGPFIFAGKGKGKEPDLEDQPKAQPSPIHQVPANNMTAAGGESSRSKRKADEISSDIIEPKNDKSSEPKSDEHNAKPTDESNVAVSQATDYDAFADSLIDGILPDAQPRDDLVVTGINLDSQNVSADSAPVGGPSSDNPEASEEPSRKRVKRSHFSTPSFKSFASGCVAGAVAAIGVAVTLLATIPLDVQEEALREF